MEIALHHKGADNSAGILLSGASLGAQLVKNLPVMQETPVQFLGQEDPLKKRTGYPFQYSCLGNPMDRGTWQATVHGLQRIGHDLMTKQQQ